MQTKQNNELGKIYAYLELDTMTDGRLRLKSKIMKKTIFETMQMKEGIETEWIDKIANRTNVSTRKIREDYIQPLVTEGILERFGHGQIRFVGLPNGVSISTEETETFNEHVKNNPHENPEPQPKQKQQQQKKVQ